MLLNVTGASSNATFQWLRNDNVLMGATQSSFKATVSGKYRVVVTVNAASDTLQAVHVDVIDKPDVRLNGTGATNVNGEPYFKLCASNAQVFTFTNASATTEANTNYVIRWGDGTPDFVSTSFNAPITHLYPIGVRKMTFIVYAGSCVDSVVYTIFVGNVPAGGLVGVGGSTICSGNEQEFVIAGTGNNPLGTRYVLFYNDGSKRDTFFHPAPDTVRHIFNRSSCGFASSNGTQTFPNSYGAFLTISNPCGVAGASILPIYVSDKPKAQMTITPGDTACVNQTVTFTNSTPTSNNVENGTCTPVKFVWRIRSLTPSGSWTVINGTPGNDFGSPNPGVWTTGSRVLNLRFNQAGTYAVKLVIVNSTLCGADSIERIVCINPLPEASFTTNLTSGCAPLLVNAKGITNSITCGQNRFNWSVLYTPAAGCKPDTASFVFLNGTSASSAEPQIEFRNPGSYRLRLQVFSPRNACSSVIREQVIEVKGKPVVQLNTPSEICFGTGIRPAAAVSCYTTGATYTWSFEGALPSSFNGVAPDSIQYQAPGTFGIRLSAVNECGSTDSVKSIIVKPLPEVSQPVSVVVCNGARVNLDSFTGSNAATQYQWTNNRLSVGLPTGGTGSIPGFIAVNNDTLPAVATIHVTPVLNGCVGATRSFTITVLPTPAAPMGNLTVSYCLNQPAIPLSVALLPGHRAVWYNVAAGGTGSATPPVPVTTVSGTQLFYVSQLDTVTGCESKRVAVSVTVQPRIELPGVDQTVCSGSPFAIEPSGVPAGTTYSWSTPVTDPDITGGTSAIAQLSIGGRLVNTTNTVQTALYTVAPSLRTCNGDSFQIRIKVNPVPLIADKQVTICSGDFFEVNPQMQTGGDRVPAGTFYTWSVAGVQPAGAASGASGQSTPVATIRQQLLTNTNIPVVVTYKVVPRTSGIIPCSGDTFKITVTINPRPRMPEQTVTVCSRSTLQFTPANSLPQTVVPSGTRYIWSGPVVTPAGSVSGGSAQSIPQESIQQVLINTTTATALVTYSVTPVHGDCIGEPFLLKVYVNPQPGITDQNAEICSGSVFSVIPSGIPANTRFTWGQPVVNPEGAVTGATAQAIPQLAISQQLMNTTSQTATVTYTVTPTTGTCSNASFQVMVKVFAKPQIEDMELSTCTGGTVEFRTGEITAARILPAGTKFTWSMPVSLPVGAVSGATAQVDPTDRFVQTLVNNTRNQITLTYLVTPVSGAEGFCIGEPFKIRVLVNPDSKAELSYASQINCAPFNINGSVLSNLSPVTASKDFKWYVNNLFYSSSVEFPGYILNAPSDSVLIKLVAINRYGCKNDSAEAWFYTRPQPDAVFDVTTNGQCGPVEVTVKNKSLYHPSFQYRWELGNGQVSTIYQPDTFILPAAASFEDTTYTIRLTAWNQCDTFTMTKTVLVRSGPGSSFILNRRTGCSPVKILFTNTSVGLNNSYVWDFGDGSAPGIATVRDTISHTFITGDVSVFQVKLIAKNHCGSDTSIIPVTIKPSQIRLAFRVEKNLSKGCAPFKIALINNSTGSSTYKWDLGDGTVMTTTKGTDTIYHTYYTPGRFDVNVIAGNGCSDTTAYVTGIDVYGKPVAAFIADKYNLCIGDSVRFTNQSQDAGFYSWNYGNTGRSNLPNPSYAYPAAGTYNVSLVAIKTHLPGVSCADTARRTIVVKDTLPLTYNVSPDKGACTPLLVQFSHNQFPSVSTTWEFGDGKYSNSESAVHSYLQNGEYQSRLIVKTQGGCVYTGSRNISINGPAGTAKVQAGYQCAGVPLRFEATAFNTDSIEWHFGDGQKMVTKNRVINHVYEAAGLYVPRAFFRSAGGCVFEVPLRDTIKVDRVKAGFTYNMNQVCGYTEVRFTDTTRSLFGKSLVQWSFGDGTVSTGASQSRRFTASNNYKVVLMVAGVSGCTDTVSVNLPVTVKSSPVVDFKLPSVVCNNETVAMDAFVLSSDSVQVLQWQFNNGFVSNRAKLNYVFSAPGTQSVTLIAGTVAGCYDTIQRSTTVLQAPVVNVTDNITICKSKTTVLTATGAMNYQWSPFEGLSNPTASTTTASPSFTTQYILKGTASNGCASFDSVTVSVVQPFRIAAGRSDSICIGKSLQLSASGAASYQWFPAAGLSNNTVANPVASPVVSTNYRVVGFDANRCFTDTAYVKVGVGHFPVVKLGPDQSLSTGTDFLFKPEVVNGPIMKWQWEPATDLSCNNCPQPVATIKNDISYRVTVTNLYGCTGSDTIELKTFCNSAQVFVPNAFTPDGDGINDVMMVRAKGIGVVKSFRIFNRWGDLVFERYQFAPNDPRNGWDGLVRGKPSASDVFVYTVEVLCDNGTPYSYKGNITLIK